MRILVNKCRGLLSRSLTALKVFRSPENFSIYEKRKFDHHRVSFSQEGEDLILARLFEKKGEPGFYVDVGAHHPQRFSNTYYFYLQGWRGINIDPLPGSMDIFNRLRPRDTNVECAISDKNEELKYYMFNEPALNGFSKDISEERDGLRDYRIIGQKKITTRRLTDVLDEKLPAGQKIDFFSIDVEGLDIQVLRSNDWDKYRPEIVLVEELNRLSMKELPNSPVTKFLESKGFCFDAKAVNTLIFRSVAS